MKYDKLRREHDNVLSGGGKRVEHTTFGPVRIHLKFFLSALRSKEMMLIEYLT